MRRPASAGSFIASNAKDIKQFAMSLGRPSKDFP
jgi:hypothetical protein